MYKSIDHFTTSSHHNNEICFIYFQNYAGNSWKIDFPLDEEENAKGEESCKEEVLHENMPHPPEATPVPPTPEPEEK